MKQMTEVKVDSNNREADNEQDVLITKFALMARDSLVPKPNADGSKCSLVSTVPSSRDLSQQMNKGQSARSVDSQGNVKFGGVRVQKHRMTLGDHPDAQGIPVTMAWEACETEEFGDVDSFEASGDHELKRISKNRRANIGARHHSRTSLIRVEQENLKIKLSREASEKEDIRQALRKEEREERRKKGVIRRIIGRGKRNENT